MFESVWQAGGLPVDWGDAQLATRFKNISRRVDSNTNREVALLCITGKILDASSESNEMLHPGEHHI